MLYAENTLNSNYDKNPSSGFNTSSSSNQHVTTTSDGTATAIHQLNNVIQEIAQISRESRDFNTSITLSNSTDISLAISSNAPGDASSLSNSMDKERDSLSAI